MKTLGLTGSIGMGKSEAAKSFVELGVPVFDSDACVHELFQNNEALKSEIKTLYPKAVEDNQINRNLLGAEVFGSKEKTKQLEGLIHPLVTAQQKLFLEKYQKQNTPLVVFDIPLLFETGAEDRFDKTLVISASQATQKQRVLGREGMSAEKFEAILAQQTTDSDKRERADFVISSDHGITTMQKDIKDLIKTLLADGA